MPKRCGIYKIESPSGKIYIGSSANIRKRINEHKGHFARGDHYNMKLRNAAKKYGPDAMLFSVVELCDRAVLRETEQRLINEHKPAYNIEMTVGKVLHDFWTDDEWRKRNSERCRIQNNERWKDPEYRKKMSGNVLNMQTDEVKAKARASRLKMFADNTPAAQKLKKISGDRFRALHQDPEFKAAHSKRMSEAAKKRLSDPTQIKAAADRFGKANSRPLCCVTTGECFKSVTAAAEAKGISVTVIKKQLRNEPTRTGYQWRYMQGEELAMFGMTKARTDKPKYTYRGGASRKPVLCVELGLMFAGSRNAYAAFGVENSSVISVALTKGGNALGYSWRFLSKDECPEVFREYAFGELESLRRCSKKKAVVCVETNIQYASALDAAMSLTGAEKDKHAIYDCLRGRKKKALGHTWRYADAVTGSAETATALTSARS